jgi:hypothetical protein
MASKVLLVLGLLPLSCTSSLAPAADVQGTWAADFNVPGASLVLDLKQSQAVIQGTGNYAIEAGRAGTLEVSGSYSRPTITLIIGFDYGRTETYTGTVLGSHMRGMVADSAGRQSALSFTRH